jgi:hypothetical protein
VAPAGALAATHWETDVTALLTINGVEVLCTASDVEPVTLGEVVRSANGWPRRTGTVRKRNYRFSTSLLTLEEAEALRCLVEGDGEVVSFDDDSSATSYLYTSRYAPPLVSSGVSRSTDFPKHGTGNLRVAAGGTVQWSVPGTGAITVLYFGRSVAPTPGAWNHLAWNSSSGRWVEGVNYPSDGYPVGLSVDDDAPSVGFECPEGFTTFDVDDVVILPFAAPSAWMVAFHAFHAGPSGQAWPALPLVRAAGARIPGVGLDCVGEAGPGRTVSLLSTSGESFDFTLYGT